MNVFNKVTLQFMKKNKTRTIVTIIGIILSTAMICSVTAFSSSLLNYGKEETIYSEGNWHIRQCDTEYKTYENIADNEEVEQAAYLQQIGYAYTGSEEDIMKPYIYVGGMSKDAEEVFPFHITSGRYPENSSEIVLPEHLYTEGGIKYEIGDTITLDVGKRMLDGNVMTQNDKCFVDTVGGYESNGETLENTKSRTYKVVGFYARTSYKIEDSASPGYTALTVADSDNSGEYMYDVYLRVKHPRNLDEFVQENMLNIEKNNYLLMFSGVFSLEDYYVVFYGLISIVIALIMFGSVALIYNAFSISVSERTKQFGLLASIGATKKQIRHMVLFEAFLLSAIGIPVGILTGLGGIGITLMLIGDKMTASSPVQMTLYASPVTIIIAIVIALITVLISAWIPSKRATKVSAVEAIRQQRDITNKQKKIKTSKLTYKLFGMSGVVASKYYKRNKKKYRTTVLSLFMSIVLFVSATAFTDYLAETAVGTADLNDYDLSVMIGHDQFDEVKPDELADKLKTAKYVTNVSYVYNLYFNSKVNKKYVNKDSAYILDSEQPSIEGDMYDCFIGLNFVDDDTFKKLLKEYGLNEEEYMNPENPLAIAVDNNVMVNPNTGNDEKFDLFKDNEKIEFEAKNFKDIEGYYLYDETVDENGNETVVYKKEKFIDKNKHEISVEGPEYLYLSQEEAIEKNTLKAGKVISEKPSFIRNDGAIALIYPSSMENKIFESTDSTYYNFGINSSNHSESYKELETILIDNGFADTYLSNIAASEQAKRDLVVVVRVFAYGFIILISLISVANVFNTISTNVSLRRREFAMLKSIGMTQKEFNKMMNFECLLYGSRALLYGLPASVGVTYLIYRCVLNGYSATFHLPWGAMGIAALSVFLVVFVTMMYSMRKIKNANPIDTLKNENI